MTHQDIIKNGLIDPTKIYYLNMDDTINGLLEKFIIAEKYDFHMLSEGYNDFSAGKFLATIKKMTEDGSARGVILVLDTLKKFTDLIDKRACTEFSKILRAFALKGGTVIGLAHTKKKQVPTEIQFMQVQVIYGKISIVRIS